MRNAALNASAASDARPKYFENRRTRISPARRLARMPVATMASARANRARPARVDLSATRRRFRPRNPLVGVRRLPGEPRHDDRVLLQVFFGYALVHVDVGVVHADVVVLVLLDRVETRDAGG